MTETDTPAGDHPGGDHPGGGSGGGPRLVRDYAGRPERLRPLLALWDTSVDELLERVDGIGDEEWAWAPGPGAAAVHRDGDRWVHDPPGPFGAPPSLRSIAWTAGHLGELGLLRADWTTGSRSLEPAALEWPGTAREGTAFMRDGLAAWRAALDVVDDTDLDTVGRSAFPHGLDPHLPLVDIAWWNTRELVHHASDVFTVRDLYAAGVGR
jgi:hypothetical protein